MRSKLAYLVLATIWLASATATFAQVPVNDVHVRLVLAGNRTTFRIGEPIMLVLEFTADRGGYQADTIPDGFETGSDAISISPDSGVTHWLEEFMGGRRGFRDVLSSVTLSSTPTRVPLLLNDTIRIDRPGRYSVKVATSRASPSSSTEPPVAMTTNEVSFEVEAMSDADEEKEVRRLSDGLNAASGVQAEEKLSKELSLLSGDVSSREKVRRFVNSEGRSGNYFGNIYRGLFIARNRALVLQLLEAAMRNPETPVTSGLLGAVTTLRQLREGGGVFSKQPPASAVLEPNGDPRSRAIQDAYVTELAAGLSKRSGKSQNTTAMTILTHLPKDPQASGALLGETRRVLLQQFDSLHPFDQEYLLRVYWDQLRDPGLVPSLKKMLVSTGMASKNIHDSALKRLIEIAPDEARLYVISEIRDPTSLVDLEVLGSLSDKTLPEVDSALREQIQHLASSKANFDQVYLRQKTFLAARYGTEAIYQDLIEVYRSTGKKLPTEARAGLLAYAARYNEPEALSLIEETLETLAPGQDFNFLPDLTRLYFSDGLDALLRKRLESDEPQIASTAAYLISLHGSAADQKIIEARLEGWRKDWSDRRAEAETNLQGTVERELINALTRAKAWQLPPERVKEIQQSCITQICRQNFHLP